MNDDYNLLKIISNSNNTAYNEGYESGYTRAFKEAIEEAKKIVSEDYWDKLDELIKRVVV